eukprot:TRINITY_DN6434_c0_g1_i1.p1 TRINITY_DN6434_c0_g1~~TRINITY_DN6434_c0_g1_i1.p1  ORF type:complete len:134 (+),score=23.02 TRINITY_DN6434_c0_g1_i1:80-481(+)
MPVETALLELIEIEKWKTVVVIEGGSERVLKGKEQGKEIMEVLLRILSKKTMEEVVAEKLVFDDTPMEIHNKYTVQGCEICTGRQPVEAKDPGVPTPNGWTAAQRGEVTVLITYPIEVTASKTVRQVISCLLA